MLPRQPRLGDILDDYCPRERRVTNHAVVAMIADAVKQTRCTTCDADHPYKGGKAPAPRRKKDVGALGGDALDHARPRVSPPSPAIENESDLPLVAAAEPVEAATPAVADTEPAPPRIEEHETDEDAAGDETRTDDEWPVHRRLIRATLPRVEGQTPERKEPDFTMRRPVGRGAEGNRGGGQRQRSNHRPMRHAQGQGPSTGQPSRFGGPRHGGQGQRQGSGQGGQQQGNRPGRPGGHGRKRGR